VHGVRRDRRVGQELPAQHLREPAQHPGRPVRAAGRGRRIDRRVRPVQRQPPSAPRHEPGQGVGLRWRGPHVAGVTHEQIGPLQRVQAAVVLEHAGTDLLPRAEQAEQLIPRVVEVVPPAAADQDGVQPAARTRHVKTPAGQNWTRLTKPPSTTRFTAVQKLAAGLARNATARATSSA